MFHNLQILILYNTLRGILTTRKCGYNNNIDTWTLRYYGNSLWLIKLKIDLLLPSKLTKNHLFEDCAIISNWFTMKFVIRTCLLRTSFHFQIYVTTCIRLRPFNLSWREHTCTHYFSRIFLSTRFHVLIFRNKYW